MHMETSNTINTESSQESGDPQSRVKADVKRCQSDCSNCAVRMFLESNHHASTQARQKEEHTFVNRITGITGPTSRFTVTEIDRKVALAEYTKQVLMCGRLNGEAHMVLDRVNGAHKLLRMTAPEVLTAALQQSVASSQ